MADPRTTAEQREADVALVERCRFGDPKAKRELLTGVLPTMKSALRSLLGAGPDADDALQQGAIDVLRGLPTFRGDASLAAWARTIAVRAGLRWSRLERRHGGVEDPEHVPSGPVPERLADRVPRPVAAYLAQLPAAQREALVLRHALGYTVPEIADLTSTSANTIKSRLLAARREIRRLIRQDEALGSMRTTRVEPGGGA